jgi:hypothetical protein
MKVNLTQREIEYILFLINRFVESSAEKTFLLQTNISKKI